MTPEIMTAFIAWQSQGQGTSFQQQVVLHMAKYTRNLAIDKTLDESLLVGILEVMKKLQFIRWPYWNQGDEIRREIAVVTALSTQGTNLRSLHVWQVSDDNLKVLGPVCIQLEQLTIQSYDLPDSWKVKPVFNGFSVFNKLKTLLLYTKFYKKTPFAVNKFATAKEARHANVLAWVENLVSTKQGTAFDEIVVNGKTQESAPTEEWPGIDLYLDALSETLLVKYTYKPTAGDKEGSRAHFVFERIFNSEVSEAGT